MSITLDGTDGITTPQINAGNIVGQVCFFGMTTAPEGFLKANGAAVSRTTYAALFAAIGTTYGAGDGSTTFNLPDLRGEFPRGWDDGRGVDSGRGFGSSQSHQIEDHRHFLAGYSRNVNQPGFPNIDDGDPFTSFRRYQGTFGGGGTGKGVQEVDGASAGNETRPRNIAALYCIKY